MHPRDPRPIMAVDFPTLRPAAEQSPEIQRILQAITSGLGERCWIDECPYKPMAPSVLRWVCHQCDDKYTACAECLATRADRPCIMCGSCKGMFPPTPCAIYTCAQVAWRSYESMWLGNVYLCKQHHSTHLRKWESNQQHADFVCAVSKTGQKPNMFNE